jgi:hypothetical protein
LPPDFPDLNPLDFSYGYASKKIVKLQKYILVAATDFGPN